MKGEIKKKKKSTHQTLSSYLSTCWYLVLDISAVLPVHKMKQEDRGMAENKTWCT